MRASVEKLRAQLEAFSAEEVREKITQAQMRLQGEALLPALCERFGLDAESSLLILEEAVGAAADMDEVEFALNGIAASWVGESIAWLDAVRRIEASGKKPVRLSSVLEQMSEAVGRTSVLASRPR